MLGVVLRQRAADGGRERRNSACPAGLHARFGKQSYTTLQQRGALQGTKARP
jgi:hypothetical protein